MWLRRLRQSLKKAERKAYPGSPVESELKFDYVRLSNGKIASFFTLQIENQELVFKEINGLPTAKVEFFGHIISIDKKTDGIFEDEIIFSVNAPDLNSIVRTDRHSYIKGIMLPPGVYKIKIFIRDSTNGKLGVKLLGFTIPNFQN